MANKNFQINLAFTADTSKAKQQLMDLQSSLQKIINEPVNPRAVEGMRNSLVAAGNAAATLQAHLQAATNVKTGTLDFTKLNKSLSQSKINLVDYAKKLQGIGEEGQKAFLQLAEVISTAEVPLRRSSQLLNKFWENLKKTAGWQISSNIIHGLEGSITSAYGYAQDLNESLNNIRIVTGQNIDQMAKFAAQANKAAKALSTTTTNYTNASLIYYQQGLSDQEVLERTDITIKMANVARTSAEDVSDQMTAVWNNFYDGSKSLEYYADVMTALGAATASSTEEISAGLNKFAAVAETVGLSYEYAASALATVTSTTRQSADVVGTAFKTLFARIQDLKLGETLDDGTTLGSYSESLAKVGIDIKDVNKEIKDMDTILEEMAGKWKTLDKDAQIALAQNVAGVRQYTQLIALMDNWDFFQENLQTSLNSSGTLNEQAEIYAEGWEAAQDRVTASLEAIYSKLIDDEAFIDILNVFNEILEYVDTLITSFGGLGGVITSLGAILTKVFSTQISQSMQTFAYNLQMLTPKGQKAIENARQSQLNDLISSMVTIDFDDPESKKRQEIFSEQLKYQVQFSDKAKEMSETERLINQILLDRLKIQGEALVNQEKQKSEANSLKEDYLIAGRTLIERKGKTEGLTDKQISDSQGDYSNSFKELETIVKLRLDTSTFERDKKIALEKLKIVQNALSKFDKGHQGKGKEESKELRTLLNNLKEADFEGENLKETLKKLRAELDKAQTNTQKKIIALSGEDIENIEAATQAIIDYARACQEAENGTEDFRKIAEKFGDNLDNIQGKQKEWSDNLVASADVILTTVSVLQSLKGIIDTLNNPDISGWDKFLAILSTVGTMVPMVMSSINSLTAIYKASAAAASGAAGANAAAGAGIGAAGTSAAGATPAVGGLAAAFNALIWPITLVVLGITTLAGVIVLLTDLYDKNNISVKENLEYTSNQLEAINNVYDDLIVKANEFKETLDSYNSAIDTLKTLEIGTKEYTEALEKANEEAKKLIQFYGLWDSYKYDISGAIIIDSEILSSKEQEFNSQIKQAENIKIYGQLENKQAILNSQIENFIKDNNLLKTQVSGQVYDQSNFTIDEIKNILQILQNISNREVLNTDQLYKELVNQKNFFVDTLRDGGTNFVEASIDQTRAIFSDYTNPDEFLTLFQDYQTAFGLNIETIVKQREAFEDLIKVTQELEKFEQEQKKNIVSNLIENKYGNDIQKQFINDKGELDEIGYNLFIQSLGTITAKKSSNTKVELDDTTQNNIDLIKSNKKLNEYLKNNDFKDSAGTQYHVENDADLARLYAEIVLGRTDTKDLQYLKGNGLGTLKDAEGNIIIEEFEDAFMRKQIARSLEMQRIEASLINEDKDIETTKQSLTKITNQADQVDEKYGTNFANAIMAAVASNTTDLDFSSFFGELSPTEIEELKNLSQDNLLELFNINETDLRNLGWDKASIFMDSFSVSLSEWDEKYYYDEQNRQGEKKAGDLDLDVETFKVYRDLLFEQNELFKDNAEGANLLAIAQMRLDRGAQLITDDWEDLNSIMTSTETNSTTLAKALAQVAPALQDILNISAENYEFLPETFAKDNWDLIIKAISGETGALEQLRTAASQAILTSITSNEDFTNENIAEIDNWLADQGKNLEIGVEINDEEFKESCEDLIEQAEMTADEAEAYFASKGLDVQLVANTKNGQTTYTIESITATGSANGVAGAINTINNLTNNKKNFELLDYNEEIENLKHTKDILAELENEYEKLNKEADKFYGAQKIKFLQQINNNLKEQEKILEQQKVDAWTDYQDGLNELDSARKAIKDFNIAGWDLTLNEDLTRITNYESAMKGIIDEINRRKELYEGNDILFAQEVQPLLKAYEDLKNAISLFDTGIANHRNAINAYQNNLDEQLAAKYEELTYELEIQIEINDMELQEIDFYLNRISDDFYKAGEAAGLLGDKMNVINKHLIDYENNYNKITAAYGRQEISQENYINSLKDIHSSLLDQAEALQELDKEMMEYYGNTVSKGIEELDKYTDRMEHLTSALDHYQSIIELAGKQKDYEMINTILMGRAETLRYSLDVAQEEYNFYQQQADEQREKMNDAIKDSKEWEQYKKKWEDVEQTARETQENMLSNLLEWAKAEKAIIENELAGFADELEKALTGGLSFDEQNLALERSANIQEEFLTTTNKIYETEKLIRTAQNNLDITTNNIVKNKLNNFIKETKALQEQTQLSKFELEIQQAKYNLLEAEIALEEAQNAKSVVRLRRDSEGRLGYVYTADNQKIANAQQKYEDAENALYNLRLDNANNYVKKYNQTMSQMMDDITQLTNDWHNGEIANEEEYYRKRDAIVEYYNKQLTTYSDLYTEAVSEDIRITEEAWSTEFSKMVISTQNWQEDVDKYLSDSEDAMERWQNVLDTVQQEAGMDLDSLAVAVSKITNKSQELATEILKPETGVMASIIKLIEAVDDETDRYAPLRQQISQTITYYQNLASSILDVVRAESQLQGIQSSNNNGNDNIDYSYEMAKLIVQSGKSRVSFTASDGDFQKYYQGRLAKVGSAGKAYTDNIVKLLYLYDALEHLGKDIPELTSYIKDVASGNNHFTDEKVEEMLDKYFYGITDWETLTGGGLFPMFDTGGYTGSWGPQGKLAVLHQKEIVLNAADTSNLLASVDLLHNILQVIDVQSMTRQLSGILSSPQFFNNNSQTLEQQVYIEAHFPYATDRNELEAAFNNIINQASQYANRK